MKALGKNNPASIPFAGNTGPLNHVTGGKETIDARLYIAVLNGQF